AEGTAAARPRPQPGRLPAAPPGRLPRRRGPAAAGAARAVPVRLPKPPLEPDARPLAAPNPLTGTIAFGAAAAGRSADAPRAGGRAAAPAAVAETAAAVGAVAHSGRRPGRRGGQRRPGRGGAGAEPAQGEGDS